MSVTLARRISDEAVHSKTGKHWAEWFAALDAAGARSMSHQEIVAYLREHYDLSDWWRQMVTVTYEQERKGRELHQRPDGYQVSVTRTVAVPVSALYAVWEDPARRERWLPGAPLVVRRATHDRVLRFTWGGASSVEVRFTAKGDARSQVTVQHQKLADREEVERMRAYWSEALGRLQAMLESGAAAASRVD